MKNYKILENRPEPTPDQIIQGMDFTKIKNNAALEKSALLKAVITKGFIGVVIICSAFLIYKKISAPVKEKTQAVFTDTKKTINASETTPANSHKATIAVSRVTVVKQKIIRNKTIVASPLVTDTTKSIPLATPNEQLEENSNTFETGRYNDIKEAERTYNLKQLTAALEPDDMKLINKSFAKINEKLYASRFEVGNKLYMTFLKALRQSNNANWLAMAEIDTLKWTDKLSYNQPYVHYYHSHPAYHHFPVVNISFEGATLFCEWLTVQYNADPKRKFKQVLFRLPTEKEWLMAAKGGNNSAIYPWEGKGIRNKKGQIACNFHKEVRDTLWIDEKPVKNKDVTAPVISYWPNNFGLYNMSGNVAEMISEKGIAKGGSWKDNPDYLRIDASYKYDGRAQQFVGFRYFVEILEK